MDREGKEKMETKGKGISTFGLYSALRAWSAIVLRSRRTSSEVVATIFCSVGTMPWCGAGVGALISPDVFVR
jgi:hypothetical protein